MIILCSVILSSSMFELPIQYPTYCLTYESVKVVFIVSNDDVVNCLGSGGCGSRSNNSSLGETFYL